MNFSAFHSTYEVNTPICSAFELDQYYKKYRNHTQGILIFTIYKTLKQSTMHKKFRHKDIFIIISVNSPTSNQKFQTISSAENSTTASDSEEDPETLPLSMTKMPV